MYKLFSSAILILIFVTSGLSQDKKFRLGLETGVKLSQIDGDNLAGFKKSGYSFGLLGGYRFNSAYNFVTGFYFEQTGSNRQGEKAPLLSGNYLAEIDIKQVSVLFAMSRSFGEDWDGTYRYRALAGIKYNRIMSTNSNLSSSNVNEKFEMTESDFRSAYFGLNLSGGIRLHNRFWLMGTYEHALSSILAKDSEAPFSRLIPFTFTASLVYYIL